MAVYMVGVTLKSNQSAGELAIQPPWEIAWCIRATNVTWHRALDQPRYKLITELVNKTQQVPMTSFIKYSI